MAEYEKQRLLRISENKERLKALGLPGLLSSLNAFSSPTKSNSTKNKVKKKNKEEDDEYKPSSDEEDTLNHDDDDDDNDDDDEEEFVDDSSTFAQKGKKKSIPNATINKKRSTIKRSLEDSNEDGDDSALQQAIALSLGTILVDKFEADVDESKKKDKTKMQGTTGRKKSAHMKKSRVQLTEEEVIAYFFSFDETGNGYISYHDLKRMAHAHDFNWSEEEIASMIQIFDRNKDGKLSLEDFRTIVCGCNMMLEA